MNLTLLAVAAASKMQMETWSSLKIKTKVIP